MRYLISTSVSWVSMWMSEARRWMALNKVESTSLMMGEESAVMLSMDSTSSSPSSLSWTSWMRKSSVASSSTRWALSDFCRISSMAEGWPTLISTGRPRSSSISSILVTSEGSSMITDSVPFVSDSGMNP